MAAGWSTMVTFEELVYADAGYSIYMNQWLQQRKTLKGLQRYRADWLAYLELRSGNNA